jgi:polyisoprenoid-binding protein YceI
MKKSILLLAFVAIAFFSSAQTKYFTKTARIFFDASSSLEKIDAINDKGTSVIDFSTGQIEVGVLMKAFLFERALMQEHFNENYVESDKFPKAVFKGTIADPSSIDKSKDGTYPVKATGKLTLHGVTKDVSTTVMFTVKNGAISAATDFKIETADYDIEIPGVVKDKIAKTVNINVQANYEPLKTS